MHNKDKDDADIWKTTDTKWAPDGGAVKQTKDGERNLSVPCVEYLVCLAAAKRKTSNGFTSAQPVFWFGMTCGLVLGSQSFWDLLGKHYVCKFCKGDWKPGRGHSRQLTLMDGETNLQLIVNEPPGKEIAKHFAQQAKAMIRLTPNAAPRDVPLDPTLDAKARIFLSDSASDVIWKLILADPSHEAIENMDRIARKALAIREDSQRAKDSRPST